MPCNFLNGLLDRAERESLKVSFEQKERNSKRQLAEYSSATKSVQSENESLKLKVQTLQQQISDVQRVNEQILEKNMQLNKDLDGAQSRNEERTHQYKCVFVYISQLDSIEVSELKSITIKERNKYEGLLKDSEQKIEQVEMQVLAIV